MATPYTPDVTAVGDSLFLTAMVSIIPLLVVFVFLGILKTKAHWAGLAGLASAVLVAILAFGMPVDLSLLAASQGILYGLFPIMWIVLAAIWLYELTVISGRFEDLRTSFNRVSDDPRIQGIIIAFCFGGLLEALAGFGAPVAITGVMLVSLGFSPMRAAATVLLANTAPVAFGAIGIPIITAGNLTGIDYHEIGAVVGRQTPILAMFVPLLLVMIVDGKRGLKQTWPIALVSGVAFSIAQFISSNYISVELTDIIASLAALIAVVVMLRFYKPKGTAQARERLALAAKEEHIEPTGGPGGTGGPAPVATAVSTEKLTAGRTVMAFLPYIVVIVVFSLAKLFTPLKNWLASTDLKFGWPGSDGNILTTAGKPSTATQYTLTWLSTAGTLLIISGVIVMIAYRIKPSLAITEFGKTVYKLRFALLTVGSVLGLAYVMNMSGQTITIGQWLAAGTGAFFAFLSPILGWVGTAVTGSDTSANALFATLQQSAAEKAGLDPTLLVAATAVGLLGKESDILRRVLKWSIGLLLAMCVLVYLQSNVLAWMIP